MGGTMPWRLKSDMRHFRSFTADKPVVMGRKTYLSLSIKPLPRRTNIVVTRDPAFAAPGVIVAPSLGAGLQAARADALRREADAIMVIGGGEIYAQAMPLASPAGDHASPCEPARRCATPKIDPQIWRESAREAHAAGPDDDAAFDFVTYLKKSRPKSGQLRLLRDAAPQQRACVESHGRVPYNPGGTAPGTRRICRAGEIFMPWSNQGGGPWGSGGSKGPWGQGPELSGPTPPDLEDLLRRSQDKLKSVLPGGNLGGRGVLLIVIAALVVWGFSGFFRVEPDELGAVLRFGKYTRDATPGLNYHLPYPIETVLTPKVTRVNRIDIGMRLIEAAAQHTADPRHPEESLMLTGDENIVDIDVSVFWQVKAGGAGDYLFNIQNPEGTVKAVAESAMREIVGRSDIQPILTGARQSIETSVHELMQKVLDTYAAGVQITQVQLQKVDPPAQVIESFREVQAARADLVRLQNEAETYANQKVPDAKRPGLEDPAGRGGLQVADGRRSDRPGLALRQGL